jgi:hypothetical protein
MRVAPPAVAAFAKDDLLSVVDDFGDDFARGFVGHDSAERKFEDSGHAITTVAIRALTVFAAFAAPVRLVLVVDEVVRVVVAYQDDISAATAIAAIRPAPRLVFFAAETHATATAVAGLDFDDTLVDEHGGELQVDEEADTNQ